TAAVPRGPRDRGGERRHGRRQQRGHASRLRPLLSAAELGRLAARRRRRAARRLFGSATGRGGRRPAPPQSRRVAATVGTRVSDALAARDRVLVPPKAGPALAAPERLLRRRLRARRGSRG